MALDTRYIPLTGLWQLFSDKDTGNFLRNGYVKFWRDSARTVGKEIFQITGAPPSYTYIQYGFLDIDGSWRIDLNDQGAFDLIPYAFPYDSNGDVDLYYVKVYSADDVEQFSREGIPNVGGITPSDAEVDVNYVPNPQFLLHTNLPATQTLQAGQIRQAVTDIAYGGWTFERPSSSTAVDFVTFERFGSDVNNPEKSPRYSLRVTCESPSSGDTFKDICLKFNDVNKFSFSTVNFTYALFAQVNSGGSINASVILIKNYGTGGSAQDEISLGTITIGSSYSLLTTSFLFGDNSSKTIGTLDDDYLKLVIRLPVDSIFDISFVDYNLAKGDLNSPSMPYTTNSQMTYRSLAGFMPIPAYDGSDLYLPVVLTPSGMKFDHSNIGKIYASSYRQIDVGELFSDGSQYETISYSSDGIPYARLQSKLMNIAAGEIIPRYGTGRNFVTSYYSNSPSTPINSLRIVNNSVGSVTDFTDGSIPTGFTFNNVTSGSVNDESWGLPYNTNSFYIWGKNAGSLNDIGITANTSGFTVSALRVGRPSIESVNFRTIFSVTTIAASTLAGKYFEFNSTTNVYYVWYKVDGAGTDPAPGGGAIGIQVDLLSTWTAYEVSVATASAISGFKTTNIITAAASTITTGSFWNLNTQTQQYYVWYQKDGAGTDPAPSGRLPIKVSIVSTDTDAQVATKTLLAINSRYFAVPDLRGMFLRGWDAGGGIDLDSANRWSYYVNLLQGDDVGSNQFDDILNHFHSAEINAQGIGTFPSAINAYSPEIPSGTNFPLQSYITVFSDGGRESRPLNTYVNYVIKY